MTIKHWGCCGNLKPKHDESCQYYDQLPAPGLLNIEDLPKPANAIQIGGEHYKKGGEEHWDRAWRLKYDPFQYIITKWVERWKDKGGVEDLKKAQHAIQKYIEVVTASRPEQDS